MAFQPSAKASGVEHQFSSDVLLINAAAVATRVAEAMREQVLRQLRRRGVVVGLSGGVDSSVVAALCVRALGSDRVLGLFMPEEDSDPESLYGFTCYSGFRRFGNSDSYDIPRVLLELDVSQALFRAVVTIPALLA
jgi:NH3-dependent NAD+ synthetase